LSISGKNSQGLLRPKTLPCASFILSSTTGNEKADPSMMGYHGNKNSSGVLYRSPFIGTSFIYGTRAIREKGTNINDDTRYFSLHNSGQQLIIFVDVRN
jgi:hypothetical protein